MTKRELAEKIATEARLTTKAAETVLESVTQSIREALRKGKKVALSGFGTFSVAKRAGRTGRNPQTGAPLKIKATRVPRFKPGKALKEAINE